MLDLKEMRKNPELFQKKLRTKNPEIDLQGILSMDERLRALKTSAEEFKSKKNHFSKEIGMRKQKGEDISVFSKELETLNVKISASEAEIPELEAKLHNELASLPNLPGDDIPISPSPKDNVCI